MSLRIRTDSLGRAELLGDVGDDDRVQASSRGGRRKTAGRLAMGLPPNRRSDPTAYPKSNPFGNESPRDGQKPNPFDEDPTAKPNPFNFPAPSPLPSKSNPFIEGKERLTPAPMAPPPIPVDGNKPNPFEALLSAGSKNSARKS